MAGYAGFDTPLSVDVNAIFLTGATNDSYEESLTESVTIAGPEVPTEGSSRRLFGEVREDPNAMVMQVVGGGDAPIPSARCTTHEAEIVAHPAETEVDAVVEDLDLTQVVVTHQRRRAARRFRDRYNSFVWATSDRDEHVLHEDGRVDCAAVNGL